MPSEWVLEACFWSKCPITHFNSLYFVRGITYNLRSLDRRALRGDDFFLMRKIIADEDLLIVIKNRYLNLRSCTDSAKCQKVLAVITWYQEENVTCRWRVRSSRYRSAIQGVISDVRLCIKSTIQRSLFRWSGLTKNEIGSSNSVFPCCRKTFGAKVHAFSSNQDPRFQALLIDSLI